MKSFLKSDNIWDVIQTICILLGILLYIYILIFSPCTQLNVVQDHYSRTCVSEWNYKIDKFCWYYNDSSYSYNYLILNDSIK
ncbi:hypothetical protein EOM09_07495 [bacterium]|nr:hypothetical protein [bacterium]